VTRTLRIPSQNLLPGRRTLVGPDAHYVGRVLRCRVGDELLMFDPEAATEAPARVLALDASSVVCELGEVRVASRLGAGFVHLVQALGKGDKPEDSLRAAVALGVGAVTFVESARSVSKISGREGNKRERLNKVALEAARQSLRGDVPRVRGPMAWSDITRERLSTRSDEVLRLVLHPGSGSVPLLQALEMRPEIEVWVGPEGGFDEAELAQLSESGARFVGLGPLVQRTELAAVSTCAVVLAWALARGSW
jgi:16S rRNA (uracil1498-N3)-methyltransferase